MIRIEKKYKPISVQVEDTICDLATYDFLLFVEHDLLQFHKIKQYLNKISFSIDYFGAKITDEELNRLICSIKNSKMRNKLISEYYNYEKKMDEIIDSYNKNTSIYVLSQQYNYFPIILMKKIIGRKLQQNSASNKKASNKIINCVFDHLTNIMTNDSTNNLTNDELKIMLAKYVDSNNIIKSVINSFDIENIIIAKQIDDYSIENEKDKLKYATEFENEIEQLLIAHNIEFKTQQILQEEQTKLYGKSISTPDFLLTTPIIFDNMEVHWIDAKNYYCANNNFVQTKIRKQAKKYIENYGNGIIISPLGYSENIQKKFADKIKFAHVIDLI